MYILTPQSAASTKIAVTSTSTNLFSLMDTAGSIATSSFYYESKAANAVLIRPEDGDVRVFIKATPTASLGNLLKSGVMYYFAGIDLTGLNLIRTAGTNVNCSVQVGNALSGESGFSAVADTVSVAIDEFPAAAVLADNTSLPTTTQIGAAMEGYDGTNLDLVRVGQTGNATAVTGFLNDLPMARYNATPTTRTEGQFGNLQVAADGSLNVTTVGGSTGVADNAAFTFGTTNTTPAGFVFDDTATNTVTENSAAAARISADRKQIMAGSYLDGATFTPAGANQYVHVIGAEADETSPVSVSEGQAGSLRMTLTRFLKTSMGDLLSGEDQTNNLMQVVEKPLAVSTYAPDNDTSTALEASSVTKGSAGTLYGFSFSNTNAAARYLQFFNLIAVPAETTVPALEFLCAAESTISMDWPKGRFFSTGIVWCNSSTNGQKTIGSADSLNDVNFK